MDEAPAYCALCNAPISSGPLCAGCEVDELVNDDLEDEEPPIHQRCDELIESYLNGNISYVIDEIIEAAACGQIEGALVCIVHLDRALHPQQQTVLGPLRQRMR
jgi:hypothetical protein